MARRRQDPEFIELIEEEVQLLVRQSRQLLVANANKVTAVLVSIAGDTTEKAMSRVAAARSVLEYGMRYSEMIDMKARLAELEAQWRQFREENLT